MNEKIQKIFTNPKYITRNVDVLLSRVRNEYPDLNVSRKQIQNFLKNQASIQITSEVKKSREFNTVYSPSIGNNFQMDLIVYDRFKYGKYRYILVVIDVYSRFVHCVPLTKKDANTVLVGVKQAFKVLGIPKNMNMDLGSEFKSVVSKFLKEQNITLWLSDPDDIVKNSIVERVNRTITSKLNVYRLTTGNRNWPNYLDQVIDNYNNTIHSSTQSSPNDIFNGKVKSNQVIMKTTSVLKVGDSVRLILKKNIFQKGDSTRLSTKIYTIEGVHKNRFKLDGVVKLYKHTELKKVSEVDGGIIKKVISHTHQERKRSKTTSTLKQLGIQKKNVITSKRIRKPIVRLNL